MRRPASTRTALWAAALVALGALFAGLSLAQDSGGDRSIYGQLQALERQVDAVNLQLVELDKRREALDAELTAAMNRTHATRTKLGEQQARIATRIKAAYKLSSVGAWEYLLAAQDFGDFVLRERYLDRIWSRDAALVQGYRDNLSEIEKLRAEIEKKRAELAGLKKDAETQQAALQAQLAERRAFVENVRKNADLSRQADTELAQARRSLSSEVSGMAGKSQAKAEFADLKGKLLCPTRGVVTLGFGESGEGQARRFHGGLDIKAKAGAPIRVPAPGKVVFSGRFKGFGNLVIVDHGDKYFTLYAHLRGLMLAEGASLRRGQLIGYVGSTGSLQGPYLYFELRHKGKPVDPDGWVRCR